MTFKRNTMQGVPNVSITSVKKFSGLPTMKRSLLRKRLLKKLRIILIISNALRKQEGEIKFEAAFNSPATGGVRGGVKSPLLR